MPKQPNHTCRMCGTAYYACEMCDKQRNWRAFCDTPEHYQVFQILMMRARELITIDEACEMLENVGATLTNLGEYTPQKIEEIQNIYAKRTKTEVAVKNTSKKTRRSVK